MNKRELYINACAAYEAGEPIMSDQDFDRLERDLRAEGHLDLVDKIYEHVGGSDIDDQTSSIRPCNTWDEILDFVRYNLGRELVMTLKFDGVHGKVQTGPNFRAQSRGRATDVPWDYTKALSKILPKIREECLVNGEAFVPASQLPYFKDKYNPKIYKLPRSAAITLLRTPDKHDEADLMKLVFVAYNTDRSFPTKTAVFDWLASRGFVTPLYRTVTFSHEDDIQPVLQRMMSEVDNGYPSDGVVLELNDLSIVPEVTGKYTSTQVALKVDKWGEDTFEGTVVSLDLIPKRGGYGTVLIIDPVLMPDGITQSRINAFNPGTVLREDIVPGSKIRFRRKANSMCVLVYGK